MTRVLLYCVGLAAALIAINVLTAPTPAEVTLSQVEEVNGMVLIPTTAVVQSGGRWVAYVVVNSHAWEMPVEIRPFNASHSMIVNGLRVGAPVVTAPEDDIRNRTRVRVVDRNEKE